MKHSKNKYLCACYINGSTLLHKIDMRRKVEAKNMEVVLLALVVAAVETKVRIVSIGINLNSEL